MRALTAVIRLARRARTRMGSGEGEPPALLPAERAYGLWAASYDAPPTLLQEIEARARAALLPDLAGARVLDVGCGAGRLTREALSRGARTAVGLDRSIPMLGAARRTGGGSGAVTGGEAAAPSERPLWVAGDARVLPIRDGAFDLVTCALVLAHLSDPVPALREMSRVLAPEGRLLLSDFHPDATRRGWERTFRDPASGRTFRVEAHPHAIDAHREALDGLGFDFEAVAEPRHDGTPVVFVLRAVRRPSRDAVAARGGR